MCHSVSVVPGRGSESMDWIWYLFSDLRADRFSFFLVGGKERESKDDGCFGTDEKEIQFQRWRDILKKVVVNS